MRNLHNVIVSWACLFYVIMLVGVCYPANSIWTEYRPIRSVGSGVLGDIESHLPAGHGYGDPDRITNVHEGTHGINSLLRQKYNQPSFYCLNDRVVLLDEPLTTLNYSKVADMVPVSLRGDVYELYLKQMQRWWEEQPTYVFDEFVAYTNGSVARKQLGIQDRSETVLYSTEFIVYATTVPLAAKSTDAKMRDFLKWNIERVVSMSGVNAYLTKLQTEQDAESLRVYMRRYYGKVWTKKVLGF